MVKKVTRLSKYPEQVQAEIREAVLLLRFGCTAPMANSTKYIPYNAISKALNVPYNTVQHICR